MTSGTWTRSGTHTLHNVTAPVRLAAGLCAGSGHPPRGLHCARQHRPARRRAPQHVVVHLASASRGVGPETHGVPAHHGTEAWVLRQRRPVPPAIEARLALEAAQRKGTAKGATSADRPVPSPEILPTTVSLCEVPLSHGEPRGRQVVLPPDATWRTAPRHRPDAAKPPGPWRELGGTIRRRDAGVRDCGILP